MWGRALLTTVVLTCTFHTASQNQLHPKDLLCVLLMSGLHKEDLDETLLTKLEKHHVDVDDMDDPEILKDCSITFENNSNKTRRMELTKTPQAQKNESKISEEQSEEIIELKTTETDMKNLKTKLWKIYTLKQDKNTTFKEITHTTTTTEVTTKHHDTHSMEYINKIIQRYITQKELITTTTPPPSTLDLKNVIAEITDFLSIQNKKNAKNNADKNKINEDELLKIIETTNEEKKQTKILKVLEEVLNKYKPKPEVTKQMEPKPTTIKPIPKANNGIATHNIIKDIAESVKELVLRDLRKEIISTTTEKELTTPIPTPHINTEEATQVIANIIQLFQQLQIKSTADAKHIKHDSGFVKPHYNKNIKIPNVAPIINSVMQVPVPAITDHVINIPHGPSVVHTHPLPISNSINKIEQINIYNHKPDHLPITIQTNVGQIPPLNIPLSPADPLLYQNIVVTTMNPFDYYKELHKKRLENIYKNLETKFSIQKPFNILHPSNDSEFRDPKREFTIRKKHYDYRERLRYPEEAHDTNRHKLSDINIRMSSRNPDSTYEDRYKTRSSSINGNTRTHSHITERFHEKLERADDRDSDENNKRIYSEEYNKPNPNVKRGRVRVTTRQQRPLSKKNHSKFDDRHFKNFLKTQQKVNDMLERILATKTLNNDPRSVETT